MKDVEVIVFDPRTIEVWSGMCSCVKGNGILRVPLLVDPYNVSIDSNLSKVTYCATSS